MPKYHYVAISRDGSRNQGSISAADVEAAATALQSRGFTPLDIDETLDFRGSRSGFDHPSHTRLQTRTLLLSTEELGTLISAGIEIDRALSIISTTSSDPMLQALFAKIQTSVREGRSLSEAMCESDVHFPMEYLSLIRVGESAGVLGQVLNELVRHLQAKLQFRESLQSAVVYPAILLFVAVGSLIFILTFVLPKFNDLFAEMNAQLPLLTRLVMGAGEIVREAGVGFALAAMLSLAWARRRMQHPEFRLALSRRLLGVPIVGELVRSIDIASFCRTLGLLVSNGVVLPEALALARDGMRNSAMVSAVDEAREKVLRGARLATAVEDTQALTPHAVQLLKVGEEAGQLSAILGKISSMYEARVRSALLRGLALLEPALILVLAVVISLIILSLLLAILEINNLPL